MNPIIIATLIVTGIGLVAGIGLAIASIAFSVPTDERIEKITAVLPGANCGGCGFTGCGNYAEAIIKDNAKQNLCAPGGNEVTKKIADILGTSFEAVEKKTAVVMCQGSSSNVSNKMEYSGIKTCAAASKYYGGPGACSYGCVGYGDCAVKCAFDAIKVIDGVAVVDRNKCTGCGTCVQTCPKAIIELISKNEAVGVLCKSHNSGAQTRSICKIGCIACSRCVKACPTMCISINDQLAMINYEECSGCRECVKVCPTKSIKNIDI